MRTALNSTQVTENYNHVARWYDCQHSFLTGGTDQQGREMLVEHTVRPSDVVLDAGAGTGCTSLLAAEKSGPYGQVVLLDASERMLEVAAEKAEKAHLMQRIRFRTGDMMDLPFADATFDSVLSTYSTCPLYDPAKGALDMYRVLKPGGRLGVAHSTTPSNRSVRLLAKLIESVVWRIRRISLGCRPVTVLPALEKAGANVILRRTLGIPLWPFLIFVIEKPGRRESDYEQIKAGKFSRN
jgi:ubiquinone/menaquinone biosynthesis C-methylase UbiE